PFARVATLACLGLDPLAVGRRGRIRDSDCVFPGHSGELGSPHNNQDGSETEKTDDSHARFGNARTAVRDDAEKGTVPLRRERGTVPFSSADPEKGTQSPFPDRL